MIDLLNINISWNHDLSGTDPLSNSNNSSSSNFLSSSSFIEASSTGPTELTYLPWIILMIVGEYLFLLCAVIFLYNYGLFVLPQRMHAVQCGRLVEDCVVNDEGFMIIKSVSSYFTYSKFERCFLVLYEFRFGTLLLFVYRVTVFLYFLAVSMLDNYVHYGGTNAIYFSLWQVDLITLYFLLASIISLIGVNEVRKRDRSPGIYTTIPLHHSPYTILSSVVQVFYEVLPSCAIFVIVCVYSGGNYDFGLLGASEHLLSLLVFLPELFLNQMEVRWEHCLLNETWLLLYLIFIWSLVGSHPKNFEWPYFFLKVDERTSFAWFTGLAVLSTVTYLLWWIINVCKFALWKAWCRSSRREAMHLELMRGADFAEPRVSWLPVSL